MKFLAKPIFIFSMGFSGVFASPLTTPRWCFTILNSDTITDYLCADTKVVIPDGIRHIGPGAFASKGLESVVISDTVDRIGFDAFVGNKLVHVTIPDSVTYIGPFAFAFNGLESVILPKYWSRINNFVFWSNRLANVEFSPFVTSIGRGAFGHNRFTSLVIPESVESLESGAFMNNPFSLGERMKLWFTEIFIL